MLVHLRRSLVLAVICLVFFGFVYAFAGTGVSQLLFKYQADGSITANGSTLIGQNWADQVPGTPLGSCVFHGRPDDTGPYAANAKEESAGPATTPWSPMASREVRCDQPRTTFEGPCRRHECPGDLLAQVGR